MRNELKHLTSISIAALAATYSSQSPPIKNDELNGGRTPQEERIQQRRIKNQLEASNSKDNNDSTFEDPDQAEEDRKEENETVAIEDVAPPEEQSVEEPTTTPPPPSLPLTSLQKLEAVYGTALHLDNGTQIDGGFADGKMW